MITLVDYYMGRDKDYPDEFIAGNVEDNAKFLLHQVNTFLASIEVDEVEVRSGWRPKEINEKVGGSPRSGHLVGRAIDLSDPLGGLSAVIMDNPEKLRSVQLWMEDPTFTIGWVHLDNLMRKDRTKRIFIP